MLTGSVIPSNCSSSLRAEETLPTTEVTGLRFPTNQHKTTSVFLLNYHFVFCPKRRRKILVNAVRDRLIVLLNEKAAELGWQVIALEVMPDHVHLFVGVEPSTAPDQVMFKLKGYTARVLRSEFPLLLKMPSLWTRSYFVSTAGNVSGATIERYIAQQTTRN